MRLRRRVGGGFGRVGGGIGGGEGVCVGGCSGKEYRLRPLCTCAGLAWC